MKIRYKKVKNLKIAYFDEGEGLPILILHGWLSSKECYIPLIGQLKNHYRIIIPDLPGFGDSQDLGRNYTFENYLKVIKNFLDKMGLKRVVLFGNSLGGTFTNLFSMKYPERVEKIIVRAPLYYKKQFSIKYRNKFSKTILKAFTKYAPGRNILAKYIKRKLINHISVNSDLYKNEIGLKSRKGTIETIKEKFDTNTSRSAARDLIFEAMEVDLREEVKKINKKTLIIWGDQDELLSNYWGGFLENLLNRSIYVEMKGSNHSVLSDNEVIIAAKIKKFLND